MAKVSEIDHLPAHRVRIRLDDGSEFHLSESLYHGKPLEVEAEVDPAELSQWILLHQYPSALNKAVSMLSLRPHSKAEISRKLVRSGFSEETIELVLFKLEKNKLLDDTEFALKWTQFRSEKRYGPRRIIQELKLKGVSGEDILSSMQAVDENNMLNEAIHLAEKKYRQEKNNKSHRELHLKIMNFIVRRGYSWELARKAADAVLDKNVSDPSV